MAYSPRIHTVGVLKIAFASMLWGAAFFFRKIILSDISPLFLSFLTFSTAAFTLYLFFRPDVSKLFQSFIRAPRAFLALGLASTVAQVGLLDALDNGELSTVIMLERIQPIIGIILSAVFLKEYIPLCRYPFVLVALGCSACLLVNHPADLSLSGISPRGVFGVFVGATGWASCTVIGRALMRDERFIPSETSIVRFTVASIIQLPLVVAGNQFVHLNVIGFNQWLIILGCGVFATAGGYVLYMAGMKRVSAPVAGLVEILMPLTGLLLAVCFLGEEISPWQLGAATLMTWSIWRLSK